MTIAVGTMTIASGTGKGVACFHVEVAKSAVHGVHSSMTIRSQEVGRGQRGVSKQAVFQDPRAVNGADRGQDIEVLVNTGLLGGALLRQLPTVLMYICSQMNF